YMVTSRYGQRVIPTPGASLGMAVVIGIFGIFWTIMAASMFSGAPAEGPFAAASCIFPLFGVLFTCAGIFIGLNAYVQAQEYQQALAAYQRRRSDVRPDQFTSQPAEERRPSDDRFTT